MKDWNIHHKSGVIIGNLANFGLSAATEKQALKMARKIYGPTVTVSAV